MCNNATQCFFTELCALKIAMLTSNRGLLVATQQTRIFCNFPTDSCGNLLRMENLDTVIVHQMMPLYFLCAFPNISTQAFTDFSLASFSA